MKFIRKDETPPREEQYASEDGKISLTIRTEDHRRYVVRPAVSADFYYSIGSGSTLIEAMKRCRAQMASALDILTDRLKALDVMIDEELRIQETRLGHVPSEYTNETEGEKEHAE